MVYERPSRGQMKEALTLVAAACGEAMSVDGTKQTLMPTMSMSAFGGKADMARTVARCPLMTQSGH